MRRKIALPPSVASLLGFASGAAVLLHPVPAEERRKVMRRILCLVLSAIGLVVFAPTAGASHLPAYELPAAACNQGTQRADEVANPASFGARPMDEGFGCHHHHP